MLIKERKRLGKHFRDGIEKLRTFYIKRLLESGTLQSTDPKLTSLTISELKGIYKKAFSPDNK
ncbi:Fur-regulated basic protein FbpA [Neobacillus bataviensis]|uniref:Fur-regulated basic protein FbpA n=1 Tax=Neobacillus bataviensis TaxID=220685 RepID=UPI0034DB5BC3